MDELGGHDYDEVDVVADRTSESSHDEPDVPLSNRRPPPPSHPAPLPYASFLGPPPPPPPPASTASGDACGGVAQELEQEEEKTPTLAKAPKAPFAQQHSSFNLGAGAQGGGVQTQQLQQFARHNSFGALGLGVGGVGLTPIHVSSASEASVPTAASAARSSDGVDSGASRYARAHVRIRGRVRDWS